MSEEITLPSGAKLCITIASFDEVMELQTVIAEALGKFSFPIDVANVDMSVAGLFGNPVLLAELADKIKSVATSRSVRAVALSCFNRCTYNGVRLSKDIFDDPKFSENARKDYYTIFMKVLEANCKPFFATTFSAFSTLLKTPTAPQG